MPSAVDSGQQGLALVFGAALRGLVLQRHEVHQALRRGQRAHAAQRMHRLAVRARQHGERLQALRAAVGQVVPEHRVFRRRDEGGRCTADDVGARASEQHQGRAVHGHHGQRAAVDQPGRFVQPFQQRVPRRFRAVQLLQLAWRRQHHAGRSSSRGAMTSAARSDATGSKK
jgi:hypothetical protein